MSDKRFIVFAQHEDGMWVRLLEVEEDFDVDAWAHERAYQFHHLGIVGLHLVPAESAK